MLFLFGGDKKRCGIRSSHSYPPLIVKSVIVVKSHWILSPTGCETSTLRKAPNRKVGFNSFFLVTESISFFFFSFYTLLPRSPIKPNEGPGLVPFNIIQGVTACFKLHLTGDSYLWSHVAASWSFAALCLPSQDSHSLRQI